MDEEGTQSLILKKMYEVFFTHHTPVDLSMLRQEIDADEADLVNCVDRLESKGLIRTRTAGPSYEISAKGIAYLEDNHLSNDDLVDRNKHIRVAILDELVRVYDEKRWSSDSDMTALASNVGFNMYEVIYNFMILNDIGCVRPTTFNAYMPTELGEEVVKDRRLRTELFTEFSQVESLEPRLRGRQFQGLFAKVIGLSGWAHEESVRTSHEEIDLVLHKNRDYYLVECKWEKDRIEASVVRELYGKVENRDGIHGLLVSMSGFTSGAVTQVQELANKKIILLFGPRDVNAMIEGKSSFDDLANEKHHKIVAQKSIVFE